MFIQLKSIISDDLAFADNAELKLNSSIENADSYYNATAANRSSSMVVIEESTLRVLAESNKDMPLEMASTTKIMTALVAIENVDLNKEIKVADEAVGVEGSSIYLKYGEIWTIRDLIYGLMLRSGNDAAVALAVAAGGSVENFVKMMNDKAAELGLKNTHFDNPNGLHGDTHYTSAYDLAVITAFAMRNEEFKKIVGTKTYTVESNDTHPTYYFANKNKMLANYDGANGVKTGYTKDSGRCLVSSAERNGMQLICAVLNIYDTYGTCAANMDKAFNEYVPVEVGKKGDILESISVGDKEYGIALENDFVMPLKDGENLGLSCRFEIREDLAPNLAAGAVIGKLRFYDDNRLLFSANIVNINEINDIGALQKLSAFVGDWQISYTNGKTQQIFSVRGGSL
ncbi:MAG: D-alanyl-D-alanine carboxypeptidase [Clostridia bacterium]|nr:D-alanyl-D-alanine carboxypeptidase [Clostridia bacterium]MDE7328739.1 D-alanyl-D-alanine carboxypeptidase [Clostridia bacterium]